jgi:hypothetical protein
MNLAFLIIYNNKIFDVFIFRAYCEQFINVLYFENIFKKKSEEKKYIFQKKLLRRKTTLNLNKKLYRIIEKKPLLNSLRLTRLFFNTFFLCGLSQKCQTFIS